MNNNSYWTWYFCGKPNAINFQGRRVYTTPRNGWWLGDGLLLAAAMFAHPRSYIAVKRHCEGCWRRCSMGPMGSGWGPMGGCFFLGGGCCERQNLSCKLPFLYSTSCLIHSIKAIYPQIFVFLALTTPPFCFFFLKWGLMGKSSTHGDLYGIYGDFLLEFSWWTHPGERTIHSLEVTSYNPWFSLISNIPRNHDGCRGWNDKQMGPHWGEFD